MSCPRCLYPEQCCEAQECLHADQYRDDARRINFEHVYPPIPVRAFDWSATLDGYEGGDPIGYGTTKEAAEADLRAQLDN